MAKKRKNNPAGVLGWVAGIAGVALAGWGAYALMSEEPKKRKKKSTKKKSATYGNGYGEGKVGGNYRKSQGPTTCANCKYGAQKKKGYEGTGSGDLYCSFWKTAVRSDYVCNQWQPEKS